MSPCMYIVHCSKFYCRSDYHYLAIFHKVPRPLSGRCIVESIILFPTAKRLREDSAWVWDVVVGS